jgi:two-component system, OmpR family, heavy metal sensor histidine kinase CusS
MRTLVAAFNDMITRLETSFKHIAEFSSQVAHELKTPIAIMRGEIELALRKERSVDEYKRVLKVSLGEMKRLLKTVEDLLLLAKLDYRPEIFKFENFNALKFFEEISEQTKILASDKDINVSMTIPKGEIIIKGDKLHLRRLFYNILHNATKFTSIGGNIDIVVKVQDNNLLTTISDTGVGILQEDLQKIFDRFFHVEKSDQSSEPGNGLGLNIALSIAKIHQGKIDVKSQPDKGTTFIITLPLSSFLTC